LDFGVVKRLFLVPFSIFIGLSTPEKTDWQFCNGNGVILDPIAPINATRQTCPHCKGKGKVISASTSLPNQA